MEISKNGETVYHLNGKQIESTKEFYIKFSSQQLDSENPNELRKMTELVLTKEQLENMIFELQYLVRHPEQF